MRRLAALLPLLATAVHAQCVMCARTAAAKNAERIKALAQGIWVLLIPPVLILTGFCVLAYKRRKA